MSFEGNLSINSSPGGSSYGGLDFQNSIKNHHQQHHNPFAPYPPQSIRQQGPMPHPSNHEHFHLSIGNTQDYDTQNQNISLGKRVSDEEEPSFTEDGNKGNKTSWQRVKWTDPMVKLLITAVSYIGKDTDFGGGVRRKTSNLQKKGKWKSVSKAMAERGHFISPQQCEDKFNDLNKRYKRLNEILGRGTSCEVVENPALLDSMDHLSDKAKEEVRKILGSKHLYYEEMCSYHNGNRLHLPPDPELQRSLQLALTTRDDRENDDGRRTRDDLDEHEQDLETNDCGHYEEHQSEGCIKRIKRCVPEGISEDVSQEWLNRRLVQLEEQKLQIKAQMLELEKEKLEWRRFCMKKDEELEMMRLENERMKLYNEQLAFELKRKEMHGDIE